MHKLVVSFVFVCTTLLSVPISSAHVEIVSSFPDQFANVNPIPTQVMIEFSGELQNLDGEILNSIEVTDSTGLVVSYDDTVIEGAKIVTKISGQSAAGVFIVKYRVVGQDGHVIEGEYTFNASPEYAEAVPTTTSELETSSSLLQGVIAIVVVLALFGIGLLVKRKNGKN